MERQGGRLKINPPLRSPAEVVRLWERVSCGADRRGLVGPRALAAGRTRRDRRSSTTTPAPRAPRPSSQCWPAGFLVGAWTSPCSLSSSQRRLRGSSGSRTRKGRSPRVWTPTSWPSTRGVPSFSTRVNCTRTRAGAHINAMAFPGRVVLTVSRGEVVWDGAQLLGSAGRGRVVERWRGASKGG